MCNPIDWTERSRSPYSPTTGRRTSDSNYSSSSVSGGSWRPHHSKTVIHENFQCTEKEQSYFFRSQCSDNGFLTVHRGRVLVQTTGLSDSDSEGKNWTTHKIHFPDTFEIIILWWKNHNLPWKKVSYDIASWMFENRVKEFTKLTVPFPVFLCTAKDKRL